MSITSIGKTIEVARENIYNNVDNISFKGKCFRADIGVIQD